MSRTRNTEFAIDPSLNVAAGTRLGPDGIARLDAAADRVVPNLTDAPAWPTLRAHLILRAVHGLDPLHDLHAAASMREIDTAADPARVLDWRLDDTTRPGAGTGPLPWLPGVPDDLADDPQWGPYLAARAARVRDLAGQVADTTRQAGGLPAWARQGQARPDPDVLVDIAVWRAATGVEPTDRRPTGPTHPTRAAHRWQNVLAARLTGARTPALTEWADTFHQILTQPGSDPFTPVLAERLSAITRAGLDAPALIRSALSLGPLPDTHDAAALWWRIAARLTPAVAAQAAGEHHLATPWEDQLPRLLGPSRADTVRQSSWWPALVTVIDHAIAAGTPIDTLLGGRNLDPDDDIDPCQALVWRISLLTSPPPANPDPDPWAGAGEAGAEPNPFWDDPPPRWAPTTSHDDLPVLPLLEEPTDPDDTPPNPDPGDTESDEDGLDAGTAHACAYLAWAASIREHAGPLPPTDAEIDTQLTRAYDADTAPVSTDRILHLNRLALAYYTDRFAGSWAQTYLRERVRVDLTSDRHIQPGYAPPGWTHLVTHLRRHGATDLELTASGLASLTRTGHLIDRFRDRLILPITTTTASGESQPVGFVARRHPHHDSRDAGPKYLNTPDTALFHKGAQLHIIREDLLAAGATPVLVEGPLDALAVSLAGRGLFVGVTPLGTSLTQEQAAHLARACHEHHQAPVIATDADPAGQVAAHRDYWLLTQHALHPHTVPLRPGSDPADILTLHGPDTLHHLLTAQTPLAHTLLTDRLTHLHGITAARQAVTVLAAADPASWDAGIDQIAAATNLPSERIHRELAHAVRRWNHDARAVTTTQLHDLPAVRARLTPTPGTGTAAPVPVHVTPIPDRPTAAAPGHGIHTSPRR